MATNIATISGGYSTLTFQDCLQLAAAQDFHRHRIQQRPQPSKEQRAAWHRRNEAAKRSEPIQGRRTDERGLWLGVRNQ